MLTSLDDVNPIESRMRKSEGRSRDIRGEKIVPRCLEKEERKKRRKERREKKEEGG